MSTQAELLTKLNSEYIKIDPTNKIRATSAKYGFLQSAYKQVQKDGGYRWRENEEQTTISTIGGTRQYSLPSDFIRLDILVRNGLPLYPTTKKATLILNPNNVQGSPNKYYLYGSNIGFDPVPSTTESIFMQYFKRLPDLSVSQSSSLPTDFDDAICAYAAYLAFNSVEKVQKASIYLSEYRQHMDTLMQAYLFDDSNIDFAIQRQGNFVPRDNVIYF